MAMPVPQVASIVAVFPGALATSSSPQSGDVDLRPKDAGLLRSHGETLPVCLHQPSRDPWRAFKVE